MFYVVLLWFCFLIKINKSIVLVCVLQVGVFYYIPYGSRNLILLALDKIDIVEENKYVIKSGYLFKNRDFEGIIGVYVGFTDKQDSDNYWICKNDYDKREAFDDFKNDNFYDYVYMGELVLSKDEILKDKFNL